MNDWQIQEANAHLSEVVKRAEEDGPQNIILHGRSVVVVVSRTMFDKLTGNQRSLVEFMRESPLHGLDELEFKLNKTLTRDLAL